GVEREDLVTFFPAKRDDDFDHRGLIIDNYDFCHSQRGEYFSFEKKKGETRRKLPIREDLTMEHDPWNFRREIENYFVEIFRRYKWHSNHICHKPFTYLTQPIFAPKRASRVN